ncbi:hypothetical protein CCAND38_160012 [Capnocytophaga canis]|uniref:Uncharacterized protein n=1 Tax=Capnocytophaga canis TaxID=1848903 RepID=A0A0B7I260_9FLAO|nr:hypothetical protein CCAND38_160012 [Capnocytophaga canis]
MNYKFFVIVGLLGEEYIYSILFDSLRFFWFFKKYPYFYRKQIDSDYEIRKKIYRKSSKFRELFTENPRVAQSLERTLLQH